MTGPASPPTAGPARHRFGIWSDTPAPADRLHRELRSRGQSATLLGSGHTAPIECLVVMMRGPLGATGLARLTELANLAQMTVAIEQPPGDPAEPPRWPREATLSWSGGIAVLDRVAHALVRLVGPAGRRFASFPALLPVDQPLPQVPLADSNESLAAQLRRHDRFRVVPVAKTLYDALRTADKATGPQEYDLIRVVKWAHERHRAIVDLRLGAPEELNLSLTRPQSLNEVVADARTRRLVMVLGEPGTGKTLQLRYYDARAALRSIRSRDDTATSMNSFYVALADQPASPDISFDWLASRWRDVVDTGLWYDLDQFVRDGGMILLDGLNEGGIRSLPLPQWMVHWRDVIRDLLRRGAAKVVVTCRTRDQVIRMRAPGDQPPTTVAILPLSREDIIAIATEHDSETGVLLDEAFGVDHSLVELYSNPFRLASFLRSGASQVASTETRLFGAAVSAAVVHEWEQDNEHGPLISGAIASRLDHLTRAGDDPWPLLESMPLIRALGGFARQLTRPAQPDGRARLAMSPRDAGVALSEALRRAGGPQADPQLIVETARDLHILDDEPAKVRFAHPSMQHLFAALGSTLDEIVDLARGDLGAGPGPDSAVPDGQVPPSPPPVTAPGYAHHRFDELFRFAAQLRGVEVPDRLVGVDPVLAARVYLSIRSEADPAVAVRIRTALLRRLRELTEPIARSVVLAALGEVGWSLPAVRESGGGATVQVPAREWQLGDRGAGDVRTDRRVGSEARTISLPSFRISRFPVSNAEFEGFVQDDGYEDRSLWSSEGWEWRMRRRAVEDFVSEWRQRQLTLQSGFPRNVIERLRTGTASPVEAAALVRFASMPEWEIAEYARTLQARPVSAPKFWFETTLRNRLQPVVGVCWFEANAFCTWLGRTLRAEVRLPSENEWEAACLYSWGVKTTADIGAVLGPAFGNTAEFGYGATTPIGTFATRDQERRVLPVELLGNVFEWIFDYYAAGIHNRRIVKGGSWQQESWRAHPAYRGRGDVDNRNDDLGFRYVITEEPA